MNSKKTKQNKNSDLVLLFYMAIHDQTIYLILPDRVEKHLSIFNAYSSGHQVLSHLGVEFVLMLRPCIPELVMSMDLLRLEYPSVLQFCHSYGNSLPIDIYNSTDVMALWISRLPKRGYHVEIPLWQDVFIL